MVFNPSLVSREDIYLALYNLVKAAQFTNPILGNSTWVGTAQKFVDSPPGSLQPFLAQFEGYPEKYEYRGMRLPQVRHLGARLWCWARVDSGDTRQRGAQYLNWMLEGIEEALKPDNIAVGKLTLGGMVEWCRIEGTILRVTGDVDQQALIIIPVLILWPN